MEDLHRSQNELSGVRGENRQSVVVRVVAQMAWKIRTDLSMSSQECKARIARALLPGLLPGVGIEIHCAWLQLLTGSIARV